MATTKLSDLTAHTTTDGAEELLINDGGTSKKVTIANLLHDNSIDSDHYVDGSIDNAHLAANSVDSDNYVDGSIDNAHLADDAVDSDELAAGAVDIAHLSATGTAGSSNFLRGDNSWVTPTDTNTTYSAGSSSALGLIKLEDDNVQTTAASAITTTSSRTYGLQVNSSGQGVVNVPWADTNTTYSVTDGELSEINFTSADHTKLNAIEASADVTDATNVAAAGALMDSECAGLAAVKATTGTFLSADESKLDAIEAAADVTDATNVAAAGAGMLSVDQAWTGSQRATLVTDNDGSFDLNAGQNFKCTPAGGLTLTFTNFANGQSGYIILVNSGGHAIARHGDTIADANFVSTVSAAGTYIISYISDGTDAFLTNSAIMA